MQRRIGFVLQQGKWSASYEEMLISGVLVVVSCNGQQEYFPFWCHLDPKILLWIQKKLRERFSEEPTEEKVLFWWYSFSWHLDLVYYSWPGTHVPQTNSKHIRTQEWIYPSSTAVIFSRCDTMAVEFADERIFEYLPFWRHLDPKILLWIQKIKGKIFWGTKRGIGTILILF